MLILGGPGTKKLPHQVHQGLFSGTLLFMATNGVATGLIWGGATMHMFASLSKYFEKYNATCHLPEIRKRVWTFMQVSFYIMYVFSFDEVFMMMVSWWVL